MRILLVNWARLPDGPLEGGGVNGYCGQLAAELARLGHEVAYLSSGLTYTKAAGGTIGPCEVRRLHDHGAIRQFDVINSPVVAPGPCQARDPAGEIAAPALEAEVARFIALLRPDVVHLHNVEGLSAGCFPAFRSAGARLVYSLHNYHTVCTQVYLMQRGLTPCFTFDAGRACVGCADTHDPEAERRQRAGLRDHPAPAVPPPTPRPARISIFGTVRKPEGVPVAAEPLPPPPGRATASAAEVGEPWPRPDMPNRPPHDADLVPLTNDAVPDPWPEHEGNDHARRRRAFLDALNACDRVLAVSEFVRRKFIALGVRPSVIRTLHIGTRMTDLARPAPPPPPSPPLRIAFLGYHNHFKGLHVLVDALDLLSPDDAASIDLLVSAKAVEPIEPRLQAMRPRLARLSVEHGYRYENVPALLRDRHVGVVPSVWWDNGPQTVLEFLACGLPVVGADLGGIPDIINHERNGLLFRGNDRGALAAALRRLVHEPGLLPRLRDGVVAPKSMGIHAAEMLDHYSRA